MCARSRESFGAVSFLSSTLSLRFTGTDLSILGMDSMFPQKIIYVPYTLEKELGLKE